MTSRVDELRQAFDASFATAAVAMSSTDELLLGVRMLGQPYALRISELVSVQKIPELTALPGVSSILGLVGVEGRLVAVFDPALVLERGEPGAAPRWIVVTRVDPSVAFAVEEVTGFTSPEPAADGAPVHVVLSVDAMVTTLRTRVSRR